MAEYIEREAAIKAINSYGTTNGSALGHHSGAVDCAIAEIERLPACDVMKVVRCKDCIHAVEIEKDYIRKLFIDGTKQCEICRGDMCYGASIISADGYCDSSERRNDND